MPTEIPGTHRRRLDDDQTAGSPLPRGDAVPAAIVYGAGGHARVVADVLDDMGFEVASQLNDNAERVHPATLNPLPGIRIVGTSALEALGAPIVIAVGDNRERKELVGLLEHASTQAWPAPLRFLTAVHSSALIAKTAIVGEGTVVLHGSIIQPNSIVGRHVLINTAASVDHDNVIGDFVHISPHVTLCGHVEVGEGTHVGAGATVIPSVKIGRWCTVGAGSVVLNDIPDGATAVGVPARIVKQD